MIEEMPSGGFISDDPDAVMEALRVAPHWLLLRREGEPKLEEPRIIVDLDSPEEEPLSRHMIDAVHVCLDAGETVLLATRYRRHLDYAALIAVQVGWTARVLPDEKAR